MSWCRMLFCSGFVLVFEKQFISVLLNTYSKGDALLAYKHTYYQCCLALMFVFRPQTHTNHHYTLRAGTNATNKGFIQIFLVLFL